MSKKYVVAEGFAFTSNGIVFSEGAEVDVTLFNGNEDLLKKAIVDGKIVESKDVSDDSEKEKDISKMNKKELEVIAKEKGVDVANKNKVEILELLQNADDSDVDSEKSEETEKTEKAK